MGETESFGGMLRRLRVAAGLTQERLAERAGVSAAGVAALEAGRRTAPRLHTVGLLCDALDVDATQRSTLITLATSTAQRDAADAPVSPTALPHPAATAALPRMRSFVGRGDELRALHDAWRARTRIALLFGEAGVGKSTLAMEFIEELSSGGVTVLVGRSTPQQLGAFESFVEPVRVAFERLGGDVPSLRELGRLVPGSFDSRGGALVPSRSDPVVDRRMLFDTVVELFRMSGPVALLADDLHWADPGSLALLAHLAAAEQLHDLMIIGTVRSTDVTTETSAALADLRRSCTVVRTNLTGLNRAELAQLVQHVAGADTTPSLIETVSDATNGNPLYVRELTEHLLYCATGAAGVGKGASPIPDGIRDTLRQRLAGLSPDAQALLRGGSVLGPLFDLRLAGHLVGLDGEALLVAVEDALLSGMVAEETATTARFSHGLVATAIYDSTPQLRRLVLHRAAAVELADRNPSAAGAIVDVARHWSIVADDDPSALATAARWAVRAGEVASASASIDEAIAWYRRATAMWEAPTAAPSAAPSAEYADALMRLGSALTAAGDLAGGRASLARALETADRAGDAEVFARAALGLSASVRYTQSDPVRIAELEAAIARLDPTELVLRPALLATLKRQLGFVDTPEADRRRNEASALLAEAVAVPDVAEELLLSLGSLRDSLILDDPEPLGQLARNIIRVASARQDLPALSTGWYRQAWSAFEMGDGELLRRAVGEYRSIAQRLRRPYELAMSSNMIAAVAQIEGRYAEAEAAGQEAQAHASTIEDGNFSWVYFANAGLRAYDEGHVEATYELMAAVREQFSGLSTFEAGYTAMAAAAGRRELAQQLCDAQLGEHGETLDANWAFLSAERLPVVGMLAWASATIGDPGRAATLRDRLERIAETGVRAVRIAAIGAWIGPIDHHLGALHRVLGDLDLADRHLAQSLTVADAMNGAPAKVRTLLEQARVARLRGTAAGDETARVRQGEAEQLADRLGLATILATVG
jgi:transcriptional regulator with XRE-family HTH domain